MVELREKVVAATAFRRKFLFLKLSEEVETLSMNRTLKQPRQ